MDMMDMGHKASVSTSFLLLLVRHLLLVAWHLLLDQILPILWMDVLLRRLALIAHNG